MIPALLVVAALVFLAYKYGQSVERIRHAPQVPDLGEQLQRSAARREWKAS